MIKESIKKYYLFFGLSIFYFPLFKYYIFLNNNNGHTFLTSDWLINYNYGFIKRGLPGTIFLSLTRNPELLLDIISGSLIVIYLLIFYFLNKTYNNKKQTFTSFILIISPAAFLFPIYDSQGAFRKEIIGILALFIVTSYVNDNNYKLPLLVASAIYTFGLFSHSVNIFFLTTILFIIYKFYNSRVAFDYILFIIPSFLYAGIVFIFSNTEQELYFIRDSICNDLRDIGLFNLCGRGSFDYLVWDLNANFVISQNFIINERRDAHYLYIILFLFTLIPYIFDKKSVKLILPFVLIGISFIPLFILAIDWGRWIYILSICFLSIYLLSDKEMVRNKSYFLLFLYPVFFRMAHCCSPMFEFSKDYLLTNLNWIIFNIENIYMYKI